MKLTNRSLYDINLGTKENKHRSRYGHEYTKYKKCLSMMMLIFINSYDGNFSV